MKQHYEDNFAVMQQSYNSVGKGRLKHVEIRYLKIREYVKEKLLKVEQVSLTHYTNWLIFSQNRYYNSRIAYVETSC